MSKERIEEKNNKQRKFEAKQNLLGFFNLLLKIDIRNDPEKYKKPKREDEYD